MAKLVAAAPFGPDQFDRLLTIAVPGEVGSFTAFTAGDDVYTFTGTEFGYDVDGVVSGTIKKISVADDVAGTLFTASGITLAVASLDFASGSVSAADIVAAAFAGNDSFTGSAGNDTLDALAGDDTIDGGAGDDLLLGSAGSDSLIGGDGNDLFEGGAGADRMAGGVGDDVFLVRQAGDVVTEAPGAGFDSVFSYVTRTLGVNQENLTLLGDDPLGGTGNGSANFIVGTAGANDLDGAGGNDTLLGGAGADALKGGSGNDLLWGQAPYALGEVTLTATAKGYLTSQSNALVGGLGGTSGFGEHVLAVGDDPSSAAIDITGVFGSAGVNFFGISHATIYVNNNGNITFDSPLPQFAPDAISAGTLPIIAPFWADVDTRPSSGSAADHVYWDLDAVNGVVTITWNAVGHYDRDASPANSFQLQLVNQGGGDFDIIFRYASISWTKGDDIVGAGTVPGEVARAGYAAGNGVSFLELAPSGDDAGMAALDSTAGNTGRTGTYIFKVRNGDVLAVDDRASDTLAGGAGKDTLTGAAGNDRFVLEHSGSGNADLIQDFAAGKDKIQLDSAFFDALAPGALAGEAFYKGITAHDADDRIIYNATGGKLYYDEDGLGGSSAVLIATLAKSPTLAASDFEVI